MALPTGARGAKVQVGVDEASGELVAVVVTTNNYHDSQLVPDLLAQVDEESKQVSGDGGDDRRNCSEAMRARQAHAPVPPQHNAKIWQHGHTKAERLARDENLRRIRQIGRAAWKRESGDPSPELGRDHYVSAPADF